MDILNKNLQHETCRTGTDLRFVNLVLCQCSGTKANICNHLNAEATERIISPPAKIASKLGAENIEKQQVYVDIY